MNSGPYRHNQKFLFKHQGEERMVTHKQGVAVPFRRNEDGLITALWCIGYFSAEPEKGTFISVDYLHPVFDEENEFGPVTP